MKRVHDEKCRCAPCRHRRFNPGPPTSGRRFNFYGHFSRTVAKRRAKRINAAVQNSRELAKEGRSAFEMPRWMRSLLAKMGAR